MKSKLFLIALCLLLTICCAFSLASCNEAAEHEHEFGAWVEEVKATCTEDGVLGHYTCAGCDKYFDANGAELANLTITAANVAHVYADDFDNTCDTCGAFNAVCNIVEEDGVVTVTFADNKSVVAKAGACDCEDRVEYCIIPHTQVAPGTYVNKCAKHDVSVFEKSVAEAHEWTAYTVISDVAKPHCVNPLVKVRSCPVCGEFENVVEPATDHQYDEEDVSKVKCNAADAEGKYYGKVTCTECEKEIDVEVEPTHAFKYSLKIENTDEDNEVISLVYACDDCDKETVEVIDAKDPNLSREYDKNFDGKKCHEHTIYYSYKVANGLPVTATETVTLNHKHVSGERLVSSVNDPNKEYVYNFSDYAEFDFSEDSGEQACWNTDALAFFTCVDCDDDTSIPVWVYIEHDIISSTETKAPTCTETGIIHHICSVCQFYDEEIPATGHNFEYKVEADANGDVVVNRYCKNEGCTEKTKMDTPDLDDDCITSSVDSTCVSAGYDLYSYTGVDTIDGEEVTYTATGKIEKNGGFAYHTLAGKVMNKSEYVIDYYPGIISLGGKFTCGEAIDAYFACSVCKELVEVKARAMHAVTSSWTVTVPAGCETDGVKVGACAVCSESDANDPTKYTVAKEVIPATGHVYTYTYNEDTHELTIKCGCTTRVLTETTLEVTKPTCANTGLKKYVGINEDGETETISETIPKLEEHNYGETDSMGQYRLTDIYGNTNENVHVFANTEIKCGILSGYVTCLDCGKVKPTDVYQPHVIVDVDKALYKEGTCTTVATYKGICQLCTPNYDELTAEELAKVKTVTEVADKIIGHNYSKLTNINETKLTATAVCTNPKCKSTVKVTLPALTSSEYTVQVNTPATCTKDGKSTYTVTLEVKEVEYTYTFTLTTKATGHSACGCGNGHHLECAKNIITFTNNEKVTIDGKEVYVDVDYVVYACQNDGCDQHIVESKTCEYESKTWYCVLADGTWTDKKPR